MPNPLELLAQLDSDRFGDVLNASPKKFREELFRHAGITVKSNAFSIKTSAKNEMRTQKLHSALKNGMELKQEVAEELIRNYLYTRRPMLADALDHFKVQHDNGLTDEDLSFIEKLEPEKGKELKSLLSSKHDARDIDLYFAFMNIPCA
jgi:hypothetical protein